MTSQAIIGPIPVDAAQLYTNNAMDKAGADTFQLMCNHTQALQIQGLAGTVNTNSFNNLVMASTDSPWGIVPLQPSISLSDNSYLKHDGYYLLSDVTPNSDMGPNYTTLDVKCQKIGNLNDYLYMGYTSGLNDGTAIDSGYTDVTPSTILNETWANLNNWRSPSSTVFTTSNATVSSGNLVMSGTVSSQKTYGRLQLVSQAQYQAPYTLTIPLALPSSLPASGNNYDVWFHLGAGAGDERSGNVFKVGVAVNSTGRTFYVYQYINKAWIPLASKTISTNAINIKLQYNADCSAQVQLDTGSGYSNIWGSAKTKMTDSSPYFIYELNSHSTSSVSVNWGALQATTSLTANQPNVVTLSAGAVYDTTPTFTRNSSEGAIPCYDTPSNQLYFGVTGNNTGNVPTDYYLGSVKAFTTNTKDSSSQQVTSYRQILTPTTTTVQNGLIQLVTTANSVQFNYWDGTQWVFLNNFGIGTINTIKPIFISPERFTLQLNTTYWTVERGKRTIRIEHPNTNISYTLKNEYDHDGTSTYTPSSGANISMQNRFYCNIYNGIHNFVAQNIATCGDTTQDVTGFSTNGSVNYTNILTLDQSEGGDSTQSAAEFQAVNSANISYSTAWNAQGTGCIKVVTPGTVVNEGIQIVVSGLTIGQPYAFQVTGNYPSGANIRVKMIGSSDFTETNTSIPRTTKVSGTATATTHYFQVITTGTAQALTYYVDMFQVEQGTFNHNWIQGQTTANSVNLQDIKTPTNQRRIMYIGQSGTTYLAQSDITFLKNAGVTDIIQYCGKLDNAYYETAKGLILSVLDSVHSAGIRYHAFFSPYLWNDGTVADPTDTTYTSQVIANAQQICVDTDIDGLSTDDFIYPPSYYNASNDNAQAQTLANFASDLYDAVHAGNPNADFSIAYYSAYSARTALLAPHADFILPEQTHRYYNLDPQFVQTNLQLVLADAGSTPVYPSLMSYKDTNHTVIWDSYSFLNDRNTALSINPAGYSVWAYPWIPTGITFNKNNTQGQYSIAVSTQGGQSGEGISFIADSQIVNNTSTTQFNIKAVQGVGLTLNIGGTTQSITGTGNWQTITLTATPINNTISITTSSATATMFYLDNILVVEGNSIPSGYIDPTTGEISSDRYCLQILRQNKADIKSDSIPMAPLTGIGFYDSNITSTAYDGYLYNAREFWKQVDQSIGLKQP